jgi:hypothetical protein
MRLISLVRFSIVFVRGHRFSFTEDHFKETRSRDRIFFKYFTKMDSSSSWSNFQNAPPSRELPVLLEIILQYVNLNR